jgi:hypothetical protein
VNQNQSTQSWSGVISGCTSPHCKEHFGIICEYHAPFLDLSCLGNEMNDTMLKPYYASCGQSNFGTSELYRWLDTVLGSYWYSRPTDWQAKAEPTVEDFIPWTWRVQASNATGAPQQCSSSSGKKLGSFAAVNIAMAIFIPIFARRTTTRYLSGDLCGIPHKSAWLYTGCFTALLYVVGNLINAALVKATPGYEDVPIGLLMLLWCSRPRLAWLTILLIPFQAEQAMYFSAAASSLVSEVILQLLSTYYMGLTANYGSKYKIYTGVSKQVPYGNSVRLMYGGAMLWLTVFFFSLVAIVWSALGLDSLIATVGFKVWQNQSARPAKASTARRMCKKALQYQVKAEDDQKEITQTLSNSMVGFGDTYNLLSQMSTSLGNLASCWREFHKHVEQIPGSTEEDHQLRRERFGSAKLKNIWAEKSGLGRRFQDRDWRNQSLLPGIVAVAQYTAQQRSVMRYCEERLPLLRKKLDSATQARKRAKSEEQSMQQAREIVAGAPETVAENAIHTLVNSRNKSLCQDWAKLASQWDVVINHWSHEIAALRKVSGETSLKESGDNLDKAKLDITASEKRRLKILPIILVASMILIWIAQWLFWAGAIEVLSDGYVSLFETFMRTSMSPETDELVAGSVLQSLGRLLLCGFYSLCQVRFHLYKNCIFMLSTDFDHL